MAIRTQIIQLRRTRRHPRRHKLEEGWLVIYRDNETGDYGEIPTQSIEAALATQADILRGSGQ